MSIRQYKEKSDEEVLSLMEEYFKEGDSRVIQQGYEAKKEISDLLSRDGDLYLMENSDGEIIGFHRGEKRLDRKSTYRSSGVYVKPEFRGKGYGSQLKQHQEIIAKERDCDLIQTIVRFGNEKGLNLAKKEGYEYEYNIVNQRYDIFKTLS